MRGAYDVRAHSARITCQESRTAGQADRRVQTAETAAVATTGATA